MRQFRVYFWRAIHPTLPPHLALLFFMRSSRVVQVPPSNHRLFGHILPPLCLLFFLLLLLLTPCMQISHGCCNIIRPSGILSFFLASLFPFQKTSTSALSGRLLERRGDPHSPLQADVQNRFGYVRFSSILFTSERHSALLVYG